MVTHTIAPAGTRRAVSRWLRLQLPFYVLLLLLLLSLSSCSPKKNTAATRNYQAFLTRYNVYFNGDEHYKLTLNEMESAYEDDYTGPFIMHPAEARAIESLPKPSGSFTRSIEKAQKAIQLHSIKKRPTRKAGRSSDPEYKKWLKRDEYNPFLHNAWMMMGRSQYMDGDFLGAASTFLYISKHFTWLPATVTEARLWEARSYCALDWLYEAEAIISRIKPDQLTSTSLKELYTFTAADYYLRMHDYDKAIPLLAEAASHASKAQKPRLYMILGRACAEAGRKSDAYQAFRKAGSGGTPRSKFNARIKQSEVYEGNDVTPEVNALKRMTRYGSNKEYQDQIFYAIGNLYLSRKDTVNAISNYEQAIARSTRNGIDKAIAQVTLGDLYYRQGRYDKAQPCYAEAVPLLPEIYPGYAMMKRRSDVLDELALFSQNVVLNDSLLRLAAMPEEQRLKVINGIIADLKKKEKEAADEAKREEFLAKAEAAGNKFQPSASSKAPQQFSLNNDRSWYFYNTATRNAGRTEFQRRWGSRKLEDDWRRRNKNTFTLSADESESNDETEDNDELAENADESSSDTKADEKAAARAADPHYPEYYIKQIPSTDAEIATANDVIQEGLYNSGLILKDRMEDLAAADGEWDKLMSRYPENVYRLDIMHNRYLMYMRQGRTDLAETQRLNIISQFPDSKYAVAMSDPAYLDKLRGMQDEQEQLYTRAYEDYLADRNAEVHRAYEKMEADYPLSPLMPKFMFLHALAYVTEDKPKEFGEVLRSLLERYPDAEPSPIAAAWHQGLQKGRELHATASNTRGMLWDIRLTNDSTALDGSAADFNFSLNPEEPHYLVLLFSTDAISPKQLLYEVARHNFSTYVVKDFDLEVMNFGQLGLLIIKGFDNQAQLNHYRSLMARDESFSMPDQVRPVEISKSNFDTLLRGGGSFDDYFRFIGEETIRDTHESVLPPDEYPSAEEMYQEMNPAVEEPEISPVEETPQTEELRIDEPKVNEIKKDSPKQETPEKETSKKETDPAKARDPLLDYPLGSEGDEDD